MGIINETEHGVPHPGLVPQYVTAVDKRHEVEATPPGALSELGQHRRPMLCRLQPNPSLDLSLSPIQLLGQPLNLSFESMVFDFCYAIKQ